MPYTLQIGLGAPVTLASLGATSARLDVGQYDGGALTLGFATALEAADVAVPFSPARLFDGNGQLRFIGTLHEPRKAAQGGRQSRQVTFLSPWQELVDLPLIRKRLTTSGLRDAGITTLGSRTTVSGEGELVRARVSLRDQIEDIFDVVEAELPVTLSLDDEVDDLHIPYDRRIDDSCAGALLSLLQWSPGLAGWWTFGASSTLHIAEAASRPLRSYDPSEMRTESLEIMRRTRDLYGRVVVRWIFKLEAVEPAEGTDGYSYQVIIKQESTAGPDGTVLCPGRTLARTIELQQGEQVPGVTPGADDSDFKTIPDKVAEYAGRLQVDAKLNFMDIDWDHQPGDRWTWAGLLGADAGRWTVAQTISRDLMKGTQQIVVGPPKHLGIDGLAALWRRSARSSSSTAPDSNSPEDNGSKSGGDGSAEPEITAGPFQIVPLDATSVRVGRSVVGAPGVSAAPPGAFADAAFKDYDVSRGDILYIGGAINAEGEYTGAWQFGFAASLPESTDTTKYLQIGSIGSEWAVTPSGNNILTAHNDCYGPVEFNSCYRPYSGGKYNLTVTGTTVLA